MKLFFSEKEFFFFVFLSEGFEQRRFLSKFYGKQRNILEVALWKLNKLSTGLSRWLFVFVHIWFVCARIFLQFVGKKRHKEKNQLFDVVRSLVAWCCLSWRYTVERNSVCRSKCEIRHFDRCVRRDHNLSVRYLWLFIHPRRFSDGSSVERFVFDNESNEFLR